MNERFDGNEILRAIALTTVPGCVYELRTVGEKTLTGYFIDPKELASAAKQVSGVQGVTGVYITINPVNPDLLARTGGDKVRKALRGETTSDDHVVRRAALVVDIDSCIRASGISATDEEKTHAYAIAQSVKTYAAELGWPVPLFADSGNGYHLRWNINIPNDPEHRSLVEAVLKALAAKFNNATNKIDTTLSNASRICKLYGTLSAKGANMPDRPHRINRILEDGDTTILPIEKMKEIAATVPKSEIAAPAGVAMKYVADGLKIKGVPIERHNWTPEEVEAILDAYDIDYPERADWKGGFKWQIDCVFNPEHKAPDAYVMLMTDGKVFYPLYKCSHDSCSEPKWTAFLTKLKADNPDVVVETHKETTLIPEEEHEVFHEDPIDEDTALALDPDSVEGDYISDLAHALTDGTFIPIGFARATLKAIVGAALDGSVGYPGEEDIHMRHWNALISARPGQGKSLIWKRIMFCLKEAVITKCSIVLPKGGFFSSGEHAMRTLAENDNKSHIAYFDEMKGLFEKGGSTGSTLFSKILELYEDKSGGVGSITNGKSSFENVSLSMTGGFTADGFENAIAGKGVGGDGFLSRMVLEYSEGVQQENKWPALVPEKINAAVSGIFDSIQAMIQEHELLKANKSIFPFVPPQDADAEELQNEFQKWIIQQEKAIEAEMPGASYVVRLLAHFKRDVLIRVVFDGKPVAEKRITKRMVERSISWAKHQLALRQALWPVDRGTDTVKCESKIFKVFRERGPSTIPYVQDKSNARTVAGGLEAWNRAWTNVCRSGIIERVEGLKNRKGFDVYSFRDKKWDSYMKKWIN